MRLNFTNADWENILGYSNIYEATDDESVGIELWGILDNVLIKGGYFKNQKEIDDYRKDDSVGEFVVGVYLKRDYNNLILRVIPYDEDEFEHKEFELYGEGAEELKNYILSNFVF